MSKDIDAGQGVQGGGLCPQHVWPKPHGLKAARGKKPKLGLGKPALGTDYKGDRGRA